MSLWKCSNCCLLNSCTAQQCQACFSPKSWECYNCGLRNFATDQYCQACFTSKQNSQNAAEQSTSDHQNDYTSDSSFNIHMDDKKVSFEEFYYQKMKHTMTKNAKKDMKDKMNELNDFIILLFHHTVLVILLNYMDCLSISNLFQSHISIRQHIVHHDFVKKSLRTKYISSRNECTTLSHKSDNICLSLLKIKLVVNKNIKRDDEQYGKSVLCKIFERKEQAIDDNILQNIVQFPCCLPFDLTNPQVHSAILNYILSPKDVTHLTKTSFALEEPLFNQENVLYGENEKLLPFNEWQLNFDEILKFWCYGITHNYRNALDNLPYHFLESKTQSLQYFQLPWHTLSHYTSLFLDNNKLLMDIDNICEILTQYNHIYYKNFDMYFGNKSVYFGNVYDGQNQTMVKDATKNVLDLILPCLVSPIYETTNQWFVFDVQNRFYRPGGGYADWIETREYDNYCASLIESKRTSDITTDVYDLTYLIYCGRYCSVSGEFK